MATAVLIAIAVHADQSGKRVFRIIDDILSLGFLLSMISEFHPALTATHRRLYGSRVDDRRCPITAWLPALLMPRDQLLHITNGIVAPPGIPIDEHKCLEDLAVFRMPARHGFQNGEGLWCRIG